MINLEELAASRARALAQPEQDWLGPMNENAVAKAVSTMSDGEIHQLFSCAANPSAFMSICEAITQASGTGVESPFQVWKDHFAELEIGLLEAAELWSRTWPSHRDFQKCLSSIQRPAAVARSGSSKKRQ